MFDETQAQTMLQWPHPGFHVHDSVWVSADDRPFAERTVRVAAAIAPISSYTTAIRAFQGT